MAKVHNRDKILHEGVKLVHRRGYGASSLRDIVAAAGVPQGSFTNNFDSKEAFGLEVLDIYYASTSEVIERTLKNRSIPALVGLEQFIDESREALNQDGMRSGCMLGNMAAEASEHSELIRHRLIAMFEEMRQAIAECLKAAVADGDVAAISNIDEYARVMLAAMQGAILISKTLRDPAPYDEFKRATLSALKK